MPTVGFEPTISAGERPQTYALELAATGTGGLLYQFLKKKNTQTEDMKTVVLKHMGQFYRVSIKSFPDYKLYYKKTTVRGIQTYFF